MVIYEGPRSTHGRAQVAGASWGLTEPEAKPEVPEEALREAGVNAVAHRDYTVRGPMRIFVMDDRVEIHTPGRAPNTVDEDAMRAGIHVVRNPHIYARLSRCGVGHQGRQRNTAYDSAGEGGDGSRYRDSPSRL
jgi:predicted HTH transcriptional regulator